MAQTTITLHVTRLLDLAHYFAFPQFSYFPHFALAVSTALSHILINNSRLLIRNIHVFNTLFYFLYEMCPFAITDACRVIKILPCIDFFYMDVLFAFTPIFHHSNQLKLEQELFSANVFL